jgi:ceramide synthetase
VHCRYWFAPVGISVGIKNTKPKKATPNVILERAYLSERKLKHKQVNTLFLHTEN